MQKMLILGATSAIAHETARNFARDGAAFYLVARHAEKLSAIRQDLMALGASHAEIALVDMNDTDRHASLLEEAQAALGGLDVVFVCYGTLGDQAKSAASVEVTMQELQTNFTSVVSILTLVANHFEHQRRGVIAVVTSVAGDRGRGSNYIYGTAMAAKNAFLSGLRNRLYASDVQVITIKPGQTITPMTAHMKKGLLWVKADVVGRDIYRGMKKGHDVIYTPFFWRLIMWIIIHIPEPIFKRLKL